VPGDVDGVRQLVHLAGGGQGVNRQLVHLGRGKGVNRKRVHLDGKGVNRQLVHLGDGGQGVNRKRVHLGDDGKGRLLDCDEGVRGWMRALADRLRQVRVCCGDWSRVCGPSPTVHNGLTAVFLDPPYSSEAGRAMGFYRKDDGGVAHAVREWAIERGGDQRMRIALCGYSGEHDMPAGWECLEWKAVGGYGNQGDGNENAERERVWFSPHCLKSTRSVQKELFA
jgi:hypothetical protein